MRVFVGYGYNERDQWIEQQVFPILQSMGFTVAHGKDLHGGVLQAGVTGRIDQSDAAIGFFTVREGQGNADYTSHIWVRDETLYAATKNIPIVAIKEDGVKVPDGLLGNRQYIALRQDDRLGCVVELVRALGQHHIRRLKIDPEGDELSMNLKRWKRTPGFVIHYHTQDDQGIESPYREGRLELVDQGFYLNVSDVPKRCYVEVEGTLNANVVFTSGWVSADAVQVKVF